METNQIHVATERNSLVETLALRFATLLQEVLGEAVVAQIDGRNAAEKNPGVCHSHDFCDANEVMLQAMRNSGMDSEAPSDHTVWSIVDQAWTKARLAGFSAVSP